MSSDQPPRHRRNSCGHSSAGSSTTLRPTRCTRTSCCSSGNRHDFGSRTAWLPPFWKIFARPTMQSSIYTCIYVSQAARVGPTWISAAGCPQSRSFGNARKRCLFRRLTARRRAKRGVLPTCTASRRARPRRLRLQPLAAYLRYAAGSKARGARGAHEREDRGREARGGAAAVSAPGPGWSGPEFRSRARARVACAVVVSGTRSNGPPPRAESRLPRGHNNIDVGASRNPRSNFNHSAPIAPSTTR
jgi:hypothetical protein